MSFKFPHLHSNKFSGLFNYKLSFQWGSREDFVLVKGLEADPVGAGKQASVPGLAHPSSSPSLLPVLLPRACPSDHSVPCPYHLSVGMFPPQGSKGAPLGGSAVAFVVQPTDLMTRGCPSLPTFRCGPERRGCSPWLSQAVGEVMMSSQGRAHAEQPMESSCNESQRVMSPEHC